MPSGFEMPGAFPQPEGGQLTRRRDTTNTNSPETSRQHLERTRREGVRFRSEPQAPDSNSGHQGESELQQWSPAARFAIGTAIGSVAAALAASAKPTKKIDAVNVLATSITAGALATVAPLLLSPDKPREVPQERTQEEHSLRDNLREGMQDQT